MSPQIAQIDTDLTAGVGLSSDLFKIKRESSKQVSFVLFRFVQWGLSAPAVVTTKKYNQ